MTSILRDTLASIWSYSVGLDKSIGTPLLYITPILHIYYTLIEHLTAGLDRHIGKPAHSHYIFRRFYVMPFFPALTAGLDKSIGTPTHYTYRVVYVIPF